LKLQQFIFFKDISRYFLLLFKQYQRYGIILMTLTFDKEIFWLAVFLDWQSNQKIRDGCWKVMPTAVLLNLPLRNST